MIFAVRHVDEKLILLGSVTIVPPVSFETLCNLDLRYWPYDAQSCDFKLGSWSHDGDRINLDLYNNQSEVSFSDWVKPYVSSIIKLLSMHAD